MIRTLLLTLTLVPGVVFAQSISVSSGSGSSSPPSPYSAYNATTATGPGFACNNALASCVDLGPGARNFLGTNASGDILLGPNDGGAATIVRLAGTLISFNATFQNGDVNLNNNAYLYNGQPGKPVMVTEPEGLSVNSTTPIKGIVRAAVTFDFPSISNGTCVVQSITVTGATLGDAVSVNADFALPAPVGIGNARVTAANTVDLRLCNHDPVSSQDPASGSYIFRLER